MSSLVSGIAIAGSATVAHVIPGASDFSTMRIWIKNTGSVALTAAKIQGSMDEGVTYEDIAVGGVPLATLASLAAAASISMYLDSNLLLYDTLRVLLTCGSSTTVSIRINMSGVYIS